MLFSLGHGQHVSVQTQPGAPAPAAVAQGASSENASPPTEPIEAVEPGAAGVMAAGAAPEGVAGAEAAQRAVGLTSSDGAFCYYFEMEQPQPEQADMAQKLDALAETMVTDAGDANSNIPAMFTYLGQFIDHDITANTDRNNALSDIGGDTLDPLTRAQVEEGLGNLRDGSLALDSLYGDDTPEHPFVNKLVGLMRFPADHAKMRLGVPDDLGGAAGRPPIPALPDNATDLLRLGFLMRRGDVSQAELDALPQPLKGVFVDGTGSIRERAIIGDGRNDENLLVAQVHAAFLRFHNEIVDALGSDSSHRFARARRLTRWHYQWLIVNDYLAKICDPAILSEVIAQEAPLYRHLYTHHPSKGAKLPMPIEFSVAAFRFGHSMVRAVYDHNRFFGANVVPPDPKHVLDNAPFNLLFAFTGNGRMGPTAAQNATGQLPTNWVIEWNRFAQVDTPFHSARKIDTHLAPPLRDMTNEGGTNPGDLVRHLARRNLRRGYVLNVPTGQACRLAIEVFREAPLPVVDLELAEVEAAAPGAGFAEHTPLWYYVLREAEKSPGDHLGPVGSYIVANTLVGLIAVDKGSYWNERDGSARWSPADFRATDPIDSFEKMLRFAGMLV